MAQHRNSGTSAFALLLGESGHAADMAKVDVPGPIAEVEESAECSGGITTE